MPSAVGGGAKAGSDLYPAGEAFSLKLICDDKTLKRAAKQHKLDKIFVSWPAGQQECKIDITRVMLQALGQEVYALVSKNHCVITASRK
jgi:hypothetical protein